MSADWPHVAVGELWAYRAKATEPVVQVEVLKLGTGRPPRVRIRFMQDEFEGREEWVPPSRLKVLWAGVEAWLAEQQRWQAIQDASWRHHDDPELQAADLALDECVDRDLAETGYNRTNGLLFIKDVAGLAALLDLEPAELTSDPVSFRCDDGALVTPWPVLQRVAQRAAELHADKLLTYVERREKEDRQHALHGKYYPKQGHSEAWYVEPEICAEIAEKHRQVHDVVRQWCGVEGRERYDELTALRIEVIRLGQLMERAISELQRAGETAVAADLEQELGIPIATLRQQRQRRQPAQ